MQTILNPNAPIFTPPSKMKIYSKTALLNLLPASVPSSSSSDSSATSSNCSSSSSSSSTASVTSSSSTASSLWSSCSTISTKSTPSATTTASVAIPTKGSQSTISMSALMSSPLSSGSKSLSSSTSSPSVLSNKSSPMSASTPKEPQCSRFSRRPARELLPPDIPRPILGSGVKNSFPRAILGRRELLDIKGLNNDEIHYNGREFRNMKRNINNISKLKIKEDSSDNKSIDKIVATVNCD